jgi:hypothetical protein
MSQNFTNKSKFKNFSHKVSGNLANSVHDDEGKYSKQVPTVYQSLAIDSSGKTEQNDSPT